MPNLMDYIVWRGDLPASLVPLCEADCAVLAAFCYNDIGSGAGGTLSNLARNYEPPRPPKNNYQQLRLDLLYRMARTARFGGMTVSDFRSDFSEARAIQFSAMTCAVEGAETVICFRGTDSTLVGWREDFDMTYETPVPSQAAAVTYLEEMAARHAGRLMIAGHSKGGNLAVYAAAHMPHEIRSRITAIYSFDGPGLDDATMTSEGYAEIRPVLHSVIPQSSVIGMLLEYHPDYSVVRSDAVSLMQHDLFSWQMNGPAFERVQDTTFSSQVLNRSIHKWLSECPPEDRHRFVDSVFSVLSSTGASTTSDVKNQGIRSVAAIAQASATLDPQTRKEMLQQFSRFLALSAGSAWSIGPGSVIGDAFSAIKQQLSSFLEGKPDNRRTAIEAESRQGDEQHDS